MPDYRRAWHPGGTYFFTVNLLERRGNDLLTRHIDTLREVVQSTRWRLIKSDFSKALPKDERRSKVLLNA